MEGQHGGYSLLWIVVPEGTNKNSRHQISFQELSYTVFGFVNRDFDTNKYRFVYSSMTTPGTTFDYDVNTRNSKLLKEKPVPNYDRSLNQVERLEAKSNDGTMVPISLVFRSDMREQGRQLLHLYG